MIRTVLRSTLSLAFLLPLCACSRAEPERGAIRSDPSALVGAASAATTDQGHVLVVVRPGEDLAARLAVESGNAKARGLKPVVYLFATWCGPCKALSSSMSDARMVDAFRGTYVIKVDQDAFKPAQFAAVGLKTGEIPAFTELDGSGHATERRITGAAWGDNIPANMAPPLKKFFSS